MRTKPPFILGRRGIMRGGFTFVELMIGMTITAMITGALAAVSFAVSRSWTETSATQSAQLTANQASLRIMPLLQNAKSIGRVREGSLDGSAHQPAAVMFWESDDNNDGSMQASEMALLEHDQDDRTIELYRISYPATMTQAQIDFVEAVPLSAEDLESATAPETFKDAVVQIDPASEPRTVAAAVVGARFQARDTTAGASSKYPTFVYTLKVEKEGVSVVEYGTAAVRGAQSVE